MQAGAAGGAAGGGAAPAHGEPTAEVEVTIECHGLRNMDTFSKSDPMAIVYAQTGDSWTQVGVTETVRRALAAFLLPLPLCAAAG
eukprot:COSAG04_NODE_767_length_10483_cov_27.449398_4_plen_85_part_00